MCLCCDLPRLSPVAMALAQCCRAAALKLNVAAVRYPVIFAGASTGVRYFLGDVGAQAAAKRGSGLSWLDGRRLAGFTFFGGAYSMIVGYNLYHKLYPFVFGVKRPLLAACTDAMLHTPTLYMVAFYCMQAGLQAGVRGCVERPNDVMKAAVAKWKANWWSDFKLSVAVWVPLHYVNFRLVPMQWRIPCMAAFGLVWSAVLAAMRGKGAVEDDASTRPEEGVVMSTTLDVDGVSEVRQGGAKVATFASALGSPTIAPHLAQLQAQLQAEVDARQELQRQSQANLVRVDEAGPPGVPLDGDAATAAVAAARAAAAYSAVAASPCMPSVW